MIDWAFRSRQTGKIAIVQMPNALLSVFLVATILRLAIHPAGAALTTLSAVGEGALVLWALDEILRGVNPWRRILGSAVLMQQLVGLFWR